MRKFRILLSLLILSCMLLPVMSSCSGDNSFIGNYTSTYCDLNSVLSKNESGELVAVELSYSLTVQENGRLSFSRNDGEAAEFTGFWKADGDELICIIENYVPNDEVSDRVVKPYFTLSFLDDGTLMAKADTDLARYIFGHYSTSDCSMILFERV